MIGVAGMMAETLWKARNDLICIDDVFDLLDDQNCMSDSDWCQAGLDRDAGFTDEQRRQIEVAFDLLRGPLWSELLRQARKLIVSRVTSIEARKKSAFSRISHGSSVP